LATHAANLAPFRRAGHLALTFNGAHGVVLRV
jgi:hypothetical protein